MGSKISQDKIYDALVLWSMALTFSSKDSQYNCPPLAYQNIYILWLRNCNTCIFFSLPSSAIGTWKFGFIIYIEHWSYLKCLFPCPCSFVFLFVPWYLLEMPGIEVSQIRFNFWIFFSNALCALALNFSIFLVIGRTGAVTIRVAGVLKDWILIALSTVIFPESAITKLNIIGYAIGTNTIPC